MCVTEANCAPSDVATWPLTNTVWLMRPLIPPFQTTQMIKKHLLLCAWQSKRNVFSFQVFRYSFPVTLTSTICDDSVSRLRCSALSAQRVMNLIQILHFQKEQRTQRFGMNASEWRKTSNPVQQEMDKRKQRVSPPSQVDCRPGSAESLDTNKIPCFR